MERPSGSLLLSKRSSHLREAGILRALTLKVNAFSDGINLGQGVCDLEMPRVLRLAAVDALFTERATYTPYAGVPALREAIATRAAARYGLPVTEKNVVVTVGSSMAYTASLMTLLDPGDEVILFEPFYPYHRTTALLCGADLRCVRMTEAGPDWGMFDRTLSPRTRLVVVNTPSNPSGYVWTATDIEALALRLKNHQAHVLSDEIYEDLVYDGRRHLPPATHKDLFDKTITISGVSKAYSITGWRLGWILARTELAHAIGPVFDVMAVCAPRPLQAAAAVAMRELPESYYRDLCQAYERRRGRMASALRSGGFEVSAPAGAYYMLADYRPRFGEIAPLEACFRLLDETHVAAIPSTIFFDSEPPKMLRFHFAIEDSTMDALERRLSR